MSRNYLDRATARVVLRIGIEVNVASGASRHGSMYLREYFWDWSMLSTTGMAMR